MESKIQQVYRDHFESYANGRSLSTRALKAGRAIVRCRTAALGGHVQACPDGHIERVWYNSCKHRACPVCAFAQIQRWVKRQVAKLIDCDYYHVIFTLPEPLRELWRCNRRVFTQLFFRAAWGSLRELLADPKWLGALPGVLAALHTWGQTLWLHPHLHFLVTAGGMTPAGQWRTVSGSMLLPTGVLRDKFRGKFLALLRQALAAGKLRVPAELGTETRCANLLNKLGRAKWNVRIQPRYQHGRGVLGYLSRYVKGGPISPRRILAYDGQDVRFSYKDNADKTAAGKAKRKPMSLSATEFLRRLLWHVPPAGLHTTRAYGLFAHAKRDELNLARALCGQLPFEPAADASWQKLCAEAGDQHPEKCPTCGKTLVCLRLLPPKRPELKRRDAA